MNINELRINNYYKINKSVSIDENVFKLDLIDIRANKNICDLIDPIPLTEEWFIRFGFEKSSEYWIKPSSSFFFGITLDGKLIYMFDDALTCPANIKYVHKLQNVFYDFTNEELTLNNL